jgi:hypothetical protein
LLLNISPDDLLLWDFQRASNFVRGKVLEVLGEYNFDHYEIKER